MSLKNAVPVRRRPWRWQAILRGGLAACSLVFAMAHAMAAKPAESAQPPLTFGILPIGGPSESLYAWRPMLDDMSAALQRPIRSISVSTYEGLAEAIAEERVDIAFVSGRMALAAVSRHRMQVIAQLTRGDGSHGYNAVLLTRNNSPIHTLNDLYRQPGHWHYARGEALSMSGYLVPETQIFASRKLDSDTFFATVIVDNHQNNALAVVNNEVDVATNNTADLERFAQHFPDQHARLRVIWHSTLIPHAVIIVRGDLDPAMRDAITRFVTQYAKRPPQAASQLAKLKLIHDISGFAPAGNDSLIPFAEIDYTLDRRRALSAQWVNEQAMQARLRKIEENQTRLIRTLKANQPMEPLDP